MTTRKETVTTFKAAIAHAPSSCCALRRSDLGRKSHRMLTASFSRNAFAILLNPLPDLETTSITETGRRLIRNQDAAWVCGCRKTAESDEQLESGMRDVFV